MGSKVINVNTVKRTKANCDVCVHLTNKGKIKYCKYYDLFSPHKKQCVRFCETLHAGLILAGITQLITVVLADKIHRHEYIRSLKPFIA